MLFYQHNVLRKNIQISPHFCTCLLIRFSLNCSDGSYYRSSRKQHHLHSKQMRESASHNRDPHMHTTIIPRTQRIPRENVIFTSQDA